MDALRLDGNAAAGALQGMFTMEVTTTVGTCASCGNTGPMGSLHLYRSAGLVLRCPQCNAVLICVVEGVDRTWIDMRGLRAIEVPA